MVIIDVKIILFSKFTFQVSPIWSSCFSGLALLRYLIKTWDMMISIREGNTGILRQIRLFLFISNIIGVMPSYKRGEQDDMTLQSLLQQRRRWRREAGKWKRKGWPAFWARKGRGRVGMIFPRWGLTNYSLNFSSFYSQRFWTRFCWRYRERDRIFVSI